MRALHLKPHLSAALLACLWLAPARADIVIDEFSAAVHDRFTNDDAFLLKTFDLSGIGQATDGRWATAISANVFVSAAHFAPSSPIYFYPSNDPTATPVVRNVSTGTKIGSTDLYVGVLDQVLPSSIAHFSFASESLSGTPPGATAPLPVNAAGSFQGLTAYLFGLSPVGNPAFRDQAVGRNVVSGYSENVPFLGNTDNDSILFAKDAVGDPDYIRYEAKFAGGDSGGPTFVELGGELVLLGTNAFIYGQDPNTGIDDFEIGGNGSGINYIGNQAAFIHSYIALHAVPEPSSWVCVALVCSAGMFHRRSPQRGA